MIILCPLISKGIVFSGEEMPCHILNGRLSITPRYAYDRYLKLLAVIGGYILQRLCRVRNTNYYYAVVSDWWLV